ncbi:MAG TPA: ABC transporter ATP-binding protein [Acidimicrobiales bacterium]|nr:ABC transporter ATP-binding protein [Acidimicrobiales bacterium]
MTAVVTVKDLCKRYGDRLVVDHVDLDVHEGEIVGLLGRNGAGKTTTVECISGLRRPDEGSVRVLGLDPQHDGPQLRSLVGSQLQDSALPDRLRVAEAIDLFRGPRAMSVDGLLAAFGLAEHRRQAFSALSGGQRQRLFLVLALLNRPKLVILDELTQGLDPAARRDVWDAIRSLRDAGTTVLLVTHYMDEAEALCDRVVVMDGGRVLDAGAPATLVDRHAPWATIRFDARRSGLRAEDLSAVEGVTRVRLDGTQWDVHGNRRMIAHVCAELVRLGSVPDDLAVVMPDLEAAVVALLAPGSDAADPSQLELTGGAR